MVGDGVSTIWLEGMKEASGANVGFENGMGMNTGHFLLQ